MAAPFSRLQLAAALLEYDNDLDDPSAPFRSAHESAIFAHLRRHPARPSVSQRRSEYLSVALPSETESVLDGKRKSRGSTIALRNPFGGDDTYEEEHDEQEPEEEEEMEVDLTSWGLDAFMSKEKSKGKGKAKSLSSAQPLSAVQAHFPKTSDVLGDVQRRPRATRSVSLGNMDFLSSGAEEMRRKSIGSPLDLKDQDIPVSFQRQVASTSQSLAYDGLADEDEPEQEKGIPFPSTSVRSPSPMTMTMDYDRQRRTYSTASLDSKTAMNNARLRTTSSGTMEPAEDNLFAIAPPSRASKFDPKAAAHARTISNASMGSRMLLENDGASVMTGRPPPQERRFSTTLELLRPKVLVMPSPLQSANAPAPPPKLARQGFEMADARPLPPGARTSRRVSTLGAANVPIPANSFTPNPRLNLSLSQLTFRNMAVDGMRDVSYNDIDGELPRAREEGEQVQMSTTPTMEMEMALPIPTEDATGPHRPAGKLYGKSLIDDLENRKVQMKSKQRVFKGDDRPSMMARTPLQRASTLIDPATLQERPGTVRMSSLEPIIAPSGLSRRNSGHAGPLLNFNDDDKVPRVTVNKGTPNRSVFGVDTLWEREMAKLKEIEAQEAFERERQQAIEETEALKKSKKKKKGKKGQEDVGTTSQVQDASPSVHEPSVVEENPPESAVSSGPPVLPIIQSAIRGPPPVVADDDSDSDESDQAPVAKSKSNKVEGWYEESSDEEQVGPRRTIGVGLRYPQKQSSVPRIQANDDSDEEDLPLAATIDRAVQRTTRLAAPESDSDEEKPLSALISKASLPSLNFGDSLSPPKAAAANDEDDDDQPLGLRASRAFPNNSNANGEDDDRPLGLHPAAEQRRTQYQMMAQAQQQQMMMQAQAQMHNSMFFNPSMSGFFPPMQPPMVMQPIQAPIPMPSPPPVQDSRKLEALERWRHDVAIEGE